ncbi:hypothetical protein BJ085DRAFT_37023 [Dimargaris cristalligena]|uniref:BED-type domain-containing protein n=1 Tax=Dimargaris cristalligena TaxID=215637 RepID=A0A4Q0A3Z7_9FUNG|nr:hypothetical protein BJ085DRAFT_37023 [Dimargaris cristalligena]|eukprot:RKP40301.1 hypothetical protein BJ085DRAFT_37023 [Dimargaris cristalligena]
MFTPKRKREDLLASDDTSPLSHGAESVTPLTNATVEKLRAAGGGDDGTGANGNMLSPATMQKRAVRQKVIDGIYTLIPPPGNHHSTCWERFNYVADEEGHIMPYTCCKVCKDVYTYKGKDTGTKGMIHHRCKRYKSDLDASDLGGVSPSMVDHLLLNGKTKLPGGFNLRGGKLHDPEVSAALASELLAQALNKDQPTYVPVNQEIRQVLLQSCTTFICQDMRSVDTFADEDFLDLLQTAINLGAKFGHFDVTRILLAHSNDSATAANAAAVGSPTASSSGVGSLVGSANSGMQLDLTDAVVMGSME